MAETKFLELNKNKYMQKILYCDPCFNFAVYEFIHGDIMSDVSDIDIKDLTYTLANIVSNYSVYTSDKYGFIDEPCESWSEFLINETLSSSKNIGEYISNNDIVFKAIRELENYKFDKKLLHGDFGTHNFVKKDGKLIGIIDPMPIIGDSLYDTLFAFSSNINIIYNLSLEEICGIVKQDNRKVLLMLIIVLYSRISRCLKYHKQDIDKYLEVWNKIAGKI